MAVTFLSGLPTGKPLIARPEERKQEGWEVRHTDWLSERVPTKAGSVTPILIDSLLSSPSFHIQSLASL